METDIKQDLLSRVEQALENIRPYLLTDGGDVKLIEIDDDHIVQVELLGACGSCPMSPMTMKAGIEEAVKRVAPEIKGINAINVE
ncbi:NifU family protein [Reichenbachiella sp. MALMAid0571]|uniref:NifU family protein n=1 Tax=Reichenbachiella sp. MALMAid0571 TaxID=3143939 RepID=UPI0032E030A5